MVAADGNRAVIFTPEHIKKITAGEKTMTRRLVKLGEFGEIKKTYQVGRTYTLQQSREWTAKRLRDHQHQCAGRHPTRARAVLASIDEPLDANHPRGRALTLDKVVTVTAVRRELLGDMPAADLRREGFRSRAGFEIAWRSLHKTYDPHIEVWVVQFHLGPPSDQLHLLPNVVGDPAAGDPDNGNYTSHLALAMTGSMDPGEALRDDEYKALGTAADRNHDLRARTGQAYRGTSDLIAELQARAFNGDEEARRHLFVINQRLNKAFRRESRDAEVAA